MALAPLDSGYSVVGDRSLRRRLAVCEPQQQFPIESCIPLLRGLNVPESDGVRPLGLEA